MIRHGDTETRRHGEGRLSPRRRVPPSPRLLIAPLLFLLTAHCALLTSARAQTIPDKMVASVTNGSRATPDLITYSDLVWQLALEPDTPSSDRPSSAQLNRALRLVEDQLLILQEARKLPSADTTDANAARDAEVIKKRNELAQAFGSGTRLEERMTRVGLTSEQLDLILRDRVMVRSEERRVGKECRSRWWGHH